MKTSEFIYEVKRLRGLELEVETYDEMLIVKNRFNENVLFIDVDDLCNVDTRFNGFRTLSDGDKIELYKLCNRYVTSSVEEREEREEPKKCKMIKFSLTRETKEELVELNNKFEGVIKSVNNVEDLEMSLLKLIDNIDKKLVKGFVPEREINKNNYDNMLRGHKPKSDPHKMLDTFSYNPCLNDFEVTMVEKALNIQLYPWQKEFLKGSNCVNINKGSGKTYLFTLAYTLKLISLDMFISYDNDVHRCVLTPIYSDTEKAIGEMFSDFYEKLSVYPFELNTTLKLSKEWSV